MRGLGMVVSFLALAATGVWLRCETSATPYQPRAQVVTSSSSPPKVAPSAVSATPSDGEREEEELESEALEIVSEPTPAPTPAPTPVTPPPAFAASVAFDIGEVALGCSTCGDATLPPSRVVLSKFWIDRDEVAAADYAACVAEGACKAASCEAPGAARCVDWYDASSYCAWRGGRLPTEAEWEAAARAPDAFIFPWGFDGRTCAGGSTADVTRAGVRDLAGDVAEWVQDFASPAAVSGRDPRGPKFGQGRVIRGGDGCASGAAADLRRRRARSRIERESWLGFRCVWSPA